MHDANIFMEISVLVVFNHISLVAQCDTSEELSQHKFIDRVGSGKDCVSFLVLILRSEFKLVR